MHRILSAVILSLAFLGATAQTATIKGMVTDSAHKGLPFATVSLVHARDSTLVTFSTADSNGRFSLRNVRPGAYILSVSYTGYLPVWQRLNDMPAGSDYETGEITLTPAGSLQLAQVTAKRPPVEINNDTIEFNSENFKTQPNAVVEDMLKKMPGVTIESDGTIKVNGQTVRRVLVNGKEFFTGDIKMATKNLSADAVDKVQVYDRISDQSTFTGVDDGNSEKTINLRLKKDRSFATFGKIAAGGGSGSGGSGIPGASGGGSAGRFDLQANINKFKGDEQLSFIGMANNTNRQGFSLMDVLNFTGELSRGMRNGGGGIRIQVGDAGSNNGLPVTGLGQDQQGIARTIAGGFNYNNSWGKGKGSINANYTVSDIRLLTYRSSATQYLSPDNSYTTLDSNQTTTDILQHRLAFILDQHLDSSLSFRLTPALTWQHTNKTMLDNYTSFAPEANTSTPEGLLLNNGFSNNASGPGATNLTTELLLRKRLAKKGRTLSGDFNLAYNHSTEGGSQLSDNAFYDTTGGAVPPGGTPGTGIRTDSNINQQYHRDAVTRSFGGNITYTEPTGKRSLLAASAFLNVNTGNSSRLTNDFNPVTGKHDLPDSLLTNHFGSDYRYYGGGLSFRSNQKKLNITAGANLQAATLNAMNLSAGTGIRQTFIDVLPNAILQYNLSQKRNVRLSYSTSTIQPSVVQLQPVADVSNPLDISTGNPRLKRSYNHNLSFNYFSSNPGGRSSLVIFLNGSITANAIVQSDSVSPYGTRLTMPVNTNGIGNLLGDIVYNFPVRPLHGTLGLGSTLSFSKNLAFVNGTANKITSQTFRPNLSYNFTESEKWDLELTASVSFNRGRYSLEPELNTNYTRQNYGLDLNNYLPFKLSLHNEFHYIVNTGRSDGYNTSIPLWNTSIAKSLFKNDRGELKFSVMDLLDRNTGITRTVNQGSIMDERYNVLQRYFLMTFTYSLNKSGLKAKGGVNVKMRMIGG